MEGTNTVCISIERFEELIIKEHKLEDYANGIDLLTARVHELEEALMNTELNDYNLRYDECTNFKSLYCALEDPLKLALLGITREKMTDFLKEQKRAYDEKYKATDTEDD